MHYIWNTSYYSMVKFYKDRFDDVKVLLYDDLKEDTQKVMDDIYSFLNVPEYKLINKNKIHLKSPPVLTAKSHLVDRIVKSYRINKWVNAKILRKVNQLNSKEEVMNDWTKLFLAKHFKDEIENLNRIIEPDLTSWIKKYEQILNN